MAACGSVAASASDSPSGIASKALSRAQTNSANEPGAVREQIREHAIARPEAGHLRPDRLDDAGDIQSEAQVARPAEADEQADELGTRRDPVEIAAVHRCGADADEDLIACRDRAVELTQLDHVGRAVPIADRGLHRQPGTAAGSSRRRRIPAYAFHGPTRASREPARPAKIWAM